MSRGRSGLQRSGGGRSAGPGEAGSHPGEGRQSPITPSTELCGILLHPAGHTRSPAMHNAAFAALGLNAVYLAFDVPPARLGPAIAGARALGVRQLAISIPHKVAALEHLDELESTARSIGAVNTLTLGERGWVGSNTDWQGAVRALAREIRPEGRRAVVLGAGGTARAVVFGLCHSGAQVTILNRTPARAEALAAELGARGGGPLKALPDEPYDILVNTTSVGMGSDETLVDPDWLRPGSVVMDVVYEPEETRLLRDAAARGALSVPGKWMLVYQAAEQLRLWSGREAPLEVMARAFDAARPLQRTRMP